VTLPSGVFESLQQLLQDCTARITQLDGGPPAGAGFFVSDSLVVTARHVIGESVGTEQPQVKVQRFGGTWVTGDVLPLSVSDPTLDIALIRVPKDPTAPAVLLHRAIEDGDFAFTGYPREDYFKDDDPGLEVARSQGRVNLGNATTQVQFLRLIDVQVKPGFSGGPILSAATGAVVAVTIYTENEAAALGGGGRTVERALDAYPELAQLAAEPPPATRSWREILTRPQWESLELVWDPSKTMDIYLTGDRSRWNIGLDSQDSGSELTFRDLGDDMSEVLVRWARSSGRRDESEVRLLGRLLSAAVFPPAVVERLPEAAARGEDPVLVRLHVDPNGPLADLPWEFITHPRDPERFLAATDGYAFARVNPTSGPVSARPTDLSPTDPVRVLTIVVQPENTTRWSPVVDSQQLVQWPSGQDIAHGLYGSLSGTLADGRPAFDVEPLNNPTLTDFNERSPEQPVDIVHYVGFGYQLPPGGAAASGPERTMIAFSRGSGGVGDLRYSPATEVLKTIASMKPRLVVLEFGTPSFDDPYEKWGQGCEPVGPSILAAAAELGVDALVCTRPVHPYQCELFNRAFYKRIAAGQTVEHAVQIARQALLTERAIDFAGFGWFMDATATGVPTRLLPSVAPAEANASGGGSRISVGPAGSAATGTSSKGHVDAFGH